MISAGQPNVLRPATAILRKLVISSQQLVKRSKAKGKGRVRDGRDEGVVVDDTAYFGFSRVWARMQIAQSPTDGIIGSEGVLRVIAKRLEGAGDLELVAQRSAIQTSEYVCEADGSLGFLNACLRSAQQEESTFYPELVSIVEMLNIRRYVSVSCKIGDVRSRAKC